MQDCGSEERVSTPDIYISGTISYVIISYIIYHIYMWLYHNRNCWKQQCLQSICPNVPNLVMGDFNQCSVYPTTHVTSFKSYAMADMTIVLFIWSPPINQSWKEVKLNMELLCFEPMTELKEWFDCKIGPSLKTHVQIWLFLHWHCTYLLHLINNELINHLCDVSYIWSWQNIDGKDAHKLNIEIKIAKNTYIMEVESKVSSECSQAACKGIESMVGMQIRDRGVSHIFQSPFEAEKVLKIRDQMHKHSKTCIHPFLHRNWYTWKRTWSKTPPHVLDSMHTQYFWLQAIGNIILYYIISGTNHELCV